jgi:hypothetical protein
MVGHRFAFLVLLLVPSAVLVACSSGGSPTDLTGTSSVSGTGGAGGAGGAGGGGGGAGGAEMITCDNFSTIPQSPCNILTQEGCDPGLTCLPLPSGANTDCFVGAGLKTGGSPCKVNEECQSGLLCVFSVCSPVCCAFPEDRNKEKVFCGNGGQCSVQVAFGPANGGKYVMACAYGESCTLFGPHTCKAPSECHLQDAVKEHAVCIPPSDQVSDEGEPCTYLNSCHADQVCGNGNKCRYSCLPTGWKDLDPGKGGCPAGQTCLPYQDTQKFGVCSPS